MPPLEGNHNWRQSFTNMVARNFAKEGNNIFYPKTDLRNPDMFDEGVKTIGTEFPLYTYLVYLSQEAFGYAHWYGRLISLIFGTLGLYFYFKIIKKILDENTALYSTTLLGVSIWFLFSRKVMPDVFSVSLLLGSVWFGIKYLEAKKIKYLVVAGVLCTLGVLSKIPASVTLGFLAAPILLGDFSTKRKLVLSTMVLFSIVLGGTWYFYWVPELEAMSGIRLYYPTSLMEGYRQAFTTYREDFWERWYFHAMQGQVAFGLVVAGLVYSIIARKGSVLLVFGICFLVNFIFIGKSGYTFATHNYYMIPIATAMAMLGGVFLSFLHKRVRPVLAILLLLVSVGASIRNQVHDFEISPQLRPYLALEEKIIQPNIPKDSLIITNGGGLNPTINYYANREGWSIGNFNLLIPGYFESFRERGASWMLIDKVPLDENHYHEGINFDSQKLKDTLTWWSLEYEDERFLLYDMRLSQEPK